MPTERAAARYSLVCADGPGPRRADRPRRRECFSQCVVTLDGDGGEVIVFANEIPACTATAATAGPQVATAVSSRLLPRGSVTSTPNAGATNGAPGEWLIDPQLIVVSGNTTNEVIFSNSSFPTYEADSLAIAPTIGDQVIEDAVNVNGTSVSVVVFPGGGLEGQPPAPSGILIDTQLDFNATVPGHGVLRGPDGDISVNQAIINTGTEALRYQFDAHRRLHQRTTNEHRPAVHEQPSSCPPFGATLEGNLTTEALEVVSGINTFDGDGAHSPHRFPAARRTSCRARPSVGSPSPEACSTWFTLDVDIFFDWSGGDLKGAAH